MGYLLWQHEWGHCNAWVLWWPITKKEGLLPSIIVNNIIRVCLKVYIAKPFGYIWYLSKNSWVSMKWREIIELHSQLIIICFYIVEKCIRDTGFPLWRSLGIHRYFLWKICLVYNIFSCEDSFGVDGFFLWKFIGFSQVFLW